MHKITYITPLVWKLSIPESSLLCASGMGVVVVGYDYDPDTYDEME